MDGLTQPRDGEDRSDAHDGVRRADDDHLGLGKRSADRIGHAGALGARKLDPEHGVFMVMTNEVLLKIEHAVRGAHPGGDRLVAHRQDRPAHSQGTRQLGGHCGEARAGAQTLGSRDVRGEVAIADLKPDVAAVAPEHGQGFERVAEDAPAGGRVGEAGQSIHNGVRVR